MDEKELKKMIEGMLNDMVSKDQTSKTEETQSTQATPTTSTVLDEKPTQSHVDDGILDDITEVDIKKQFLVPNPKDRDGYLRMKQFTPARLGLWRTGTRYMTQSVLRFRADHASAQDAVFSDVSPELVKEMGMIETKTVCKDKDEYVTRPDLGRQFSDEMIKKIQDNTTHSPRIQMVVGDGLSSAAIEANVKSAIPAIKQGLKMYNLDFDNVIFVKYCRVPAMDKIAEITDAEVVCLLVGERPGLVTAESMSAYIAYRPTVGMPEARRTVVSNIHKGGTPAVEAGAYIAELIKNMLDKKKSGIDLKRAE